MPLNVAEASEGPAGGRFIRGSTELRLSAAGRKQMIELGKQIKDKGCFWKIYYSDQMRAAESAHLLTLGCKTEFQRPCADLESWHLGGYEGKLVKDVLPQIQDLVAKRPWVVPSGMGEKSTKMGESFNTFKTRVLDAINRIMEENRVNPTKRIGVVTHFHDIQIIDSWLAYYNGTPEPGDDKYDPKVYNKDIGYPGEVIWLHYQQWPENEGGPKWEFDRLTSKELSSWEILPSGIYIIRHGDTDWN